MHLSLKPGVKMFGVRPEMVLAATVVASVYSEFNNSQCVITSITDGKHRKNSIHYKGFAMDFRTRHIPIGMLGTLRARVQACLGSEFDVVLEETHLHVEYDPECPFGSG